MTPITIEILKEEIEVLQNALEFHQDIVNDYDDWGGDEAEAIESQSHVIELTAELHKSRSDLQDMLAKSTH